MSHLYDPYFPRHLSPKPSSNSKLQEYKQRYKNDNPMLSTENFKTITSPGDNYLTPSSLKISDKLPTSNESRSSLNALKAMQGKVKTLENIIEMKDKEKEIIIRNYQDLTEKIRGDLEIIRNVEKELRGNLNHTEQENAVIRSQLERELDQMTERYQQKSQEVQVLNLRLEEKNQFIQENLSELKHENSVLKSGNDKLSMMNQNLSREIDDLQSRIRELEELNKGLSQRSQDFQKETFQIKASYDQAIEKYKQEFRDYQENNSEKQNVTETRIEELADEKRALENELKEARMNNEVLQKELDSKEIEIMRLRQRDLPSIREKTRGGSLSQEKNSLPPQTNLITMKEEIEIDKQELQSKKTNRDDFADNYIKKYTSPSKTVTESTISNNNNNHNNYNNANSLSNYTYNKTLKSIKELDREITQMNQEYQDLLLQSQNAKMSKNKEEVKQKIFYLSKMLSDATSKMYTLKMEEDAMKK